LHRLGVTVAQQRVIDLGEIGESLLRKWRIGANAQDFSVLGLELRIVVRTGRLEILDSGRAEIKNVEVDQNVLALEAAQLDLATFAAVELKIRGFLADLKRENQTRQRDKQNHGEEN
jgi:hypothetical protein